MTGIVTLAETKEFLRVLGNSEDATIAMLIEAATEAVLEYANAYDPSQPAPARLKAAVLARVAITFDDRERLEAGTGESRMLRPFRQFDLGGGIV